MAISALAGCAADTHHPARLALDPYQAVASEAFLSPHDVVLAAFDLLEKGEVKEVRRVITWHLGRVLKEGARAGCAPDFRLEGDEEKQAGTFDSIPGTSGAFLVLLEEYANTGVNVSWVADKWETVQKIADSIVAQQQASGPLAGLAVAGPGERVAFLADNCEAQAGLAAFVRLSRRLGAAGDLSRYIQASSSLASAIEATLVQGDSCFWAADGVSRMSVRPAVLFPDAVSSLYPCAFGILSEQARTRLWKGFVDQWPESARVKLPVGQRAVVERARRAMAGLGSPRQ